MLYKGMLQKKKVGNQFCMNTVKGAKKQVSTKYAINDINHNTDENKIIVDSIEISPEISASFYYKKSTKTTQ